jgi:cytochrome c556
MKHAQRITWLVLRLLMASALSGCVREVKDTHPDQLLTKRKALFKQMNRALEPIGLVANERNAYQREEFVGYVEELQKLSSKPWAFFPADGNYPPTRAKPAVWSQATEFEAAQKQYQTVVAQLAQAAQAGDLEKIKPAVVDVTNSCKSCHKKFRFD